MTSPKPLVIYRPTAEGRLSFIVACDDPGLRRLAAAFHDLAPQSPFRIGDGAGAISVEATGDGPATMTRPATGPFRCVLPVGEARHASDLIAAMAKHRGPCHQYLVAAPGLALIRITKDEYDLSTLGKMQEFGA